MLIPRRLSCHPYMQSVIAHSDPRRRPNTTGEHFVKRHCQLIYFKGRDMGVDVECACVMSLLACRSRMDELAQVYNQVTRKVVTEYMQIRNDTFALALHTFTEEMDISQFPIDMLSSLDCFHPSEKSHAFSATSLW